MTSKHIAPNANTSDPLCNCPRALQTHFTQCEHLKLPFQLPKGPQIIFHPVQTPQTAFSTAAMPSKHISHSANTSDPRSNSPHALKTHFTQCQHLEHPSQLPPCPQNAFHPMPTPQTPFSTHPVPSKHISPNANTSNPLSNCPRAVKTYLTQCQHLKAPFQLPPCPLNAFHPLPTPQTTVSTPPMPSKHISHSANTSNPRFNSPYAPKQHFTQCQHLKPAFEPIPCPLNSFHPLPTPQTPVATPPMPSKHISHSVNTSYPRFNSPYAPKPHCTHCQHLKPPFEPIPCPQTTFHPVPTPQTPFSTPPMPLKHTSASANTSNPPFYCPHALKTHFT